jgi:hypothetical protein
MPFCIELRELTAQKHQGIKVTPNKCVSPERYKIVSPPARLALSQARRLPNINVTLYVRVCVAGLIL